MLQKSQKSFSKQEENWRKGKSSEEDLTKETNQWSIKGTTTNTIIQRDTSWRKKASTTPLLCIREDLCGTKRSEYLPHSEALQYARAFERSKPILHFPRRL